jgi:uncharacterized protein (DUF433 family)
MNLATVDPLPLRREESGAIRVGNTRVLLELVIGAYKRGETPESIVDSFTTLNLADVYSVIAYYLRHRPEVEEYMQAQEEEAKVIRAKIERDLPDISHIKERLRRIRDERRNGNVSPGE